MMTSLEQVQDVKDVSGKPREIALNLGINYCKNGDPPTEGMDLSKVAPLLEGDGQTQ